MKRIHLGLLLVLIALQAVACVTRKTTIYDDGDLKVMLRSRGRATSGLQHPVQIAAVRLNHILSRIDVRTSAKDGQQRIPAIPLMSLDEIAAGFAKGLAEADTDQEVVVMSVRTQKRFGVFNTEFLTAFTGYQKDGILYVHLARADWEVPPRREDRLPEPQVGEFPTSFRIVPSESMEMLDQQTLAIDWRSDLFERPTRTRITPDGKLVRRTILLETGDATEEVEDEKPARPDIAPIPAGVSPATLRALADIEEQRQMGTLSEVDYARERLEILEAEAAGSAGP